MSQTQTPVPRLGHRTAPGSVMLAASADSPSRITTELLGKPIPNELFRAARQRQMSPTGNGRMSRQELADAVNAILGADERKVVLTENDIGKIERGLVSWPHADRRAALRAVLRVETDLEIGLVNRRRRPTDQIALNAVDSPTAAPASRSSHRVRPRPDGHAPTAAETNILNDSSRVRPVLLRPPAGYTPFLPAALDQPVLNWLVDRQSASPADEGPVGHDLSDVSADARRLDDLRNLDHQFGAGVVYPHVTEFLHTRVRVLLAHEPAVAPSTRQQILDIALGACELAGYQAVDIGADGLAQQHYLRALSLTRANRAYGAYLIAVSLGHLALHCGYPQQSLRMVQAAIMGSQGSVTPLVGAALHAVLARAFARMGDGKASGDAMRFAESCIASDDDPPWVRYLTPAYLADEAAHCLFDLGHYEAAKHEIIGAIAGVGKTRLRRLAIDGALLASSSIRAGQLDEGCAKACEAAELARRTASQRTVQRVAQIRVELSPFESSPDVASCLEYLHDTLPEAG
jgi:hypothetical protein